MPQIICSALFRSLNIRVRAQYAQAAGNERSFNRDASTDRDGHAHAYATAYLSKLRD